MRRFLLLLVTLLWLGQGSVQAASFTSSTQDPRLPGVALAESISELTGVAISPLLGMSAVGAWQYYRTPAEQRPHLAWYAHPVAWIFGLSIVALCFLKDLLGAAAPPLVKKPLDVLELFEDKLSALVASTAFVPVVIAQFGESHAPSASVPEPLWQAASALPFDLRLLTVPFAMLGFLTVWLACHSINVLITLSPFGFVDAILKLFKTALLGLVLLSSTISPFLGAAVSLAILTVACLVAPWAFRLSLFGTLFGFDLLVPQRALSKVRLEEPHVFLARPLNGVPTRTLGRLHIDASGNRLFRYRRWWLLPAASLPLPAGDLVLHEGVLAPSLVLQEAASGRSTELFVFLPRYRNCAADLATRFAPAGRRSSPVLRGWRALRSFISQIFSGRRASAASMEA